MKVKIEILQGKELAARFKSAGKKVQDFIDKALDTAALLVERTAKIYQTPHVLTGRLRASIAKRLVPMNAEVGTNVTYARKHEKDYPFLKPALVDKSAEIKKILHKGVTDAMADSFKGFTKIF
ncbi:MAG TPA: HK97 gp10 family phage protein [Methanosarcinales archaeon]|nr:HK97 gp10 family phage protein [Methanosarcinales archaeon]